MIAAVFPVDGLDIVIDKTLHSQIDMSMRMQDIEPGTVLDISQQVIRIRFGESGIIGFGYVAALAVLFGDEEAVHAGSDQFVHEHLVGGMQHIERRLQFLTVMLQKFCNRAFFRSVDDMRDRIVTRRKLLHP